MGFKIKWTLYLFRRQFAIHKFVTLKSDEIWIRNSQCIFTQYSSWTLFSTWQFFFNRGLLFIEIVWFINKDIGDERECFFLKSTYKSVKKLHWHNKRPHSKKLPWAINICIKHPLNVVPVLITSLKTNPFSYMIIYCSSKELFIHILQDLK